MGNFIIKIFQFLYLYAAYCIIQRMTKISLVESALKEACLLSQASWAARVGYQAGRLASA
jgi:hypothetical protein